ncbi:MAG: radical SAM protein [Candidatus Omnitrophica bacterium]|nr:radical SAM protein [Candidatus Omnitrophota bacterium]
MIGKYFKALKFLFYNYPTYLILFTTARCNARCRHCFYLDSIDKSNVDSELTLDEYEKISKSLKHVKALIITGGEPTLRDDIPEICRIFYKNNGVQYIAVHTNGFFTDKIGDISKTILNSLQDAYLDVKISIDNIGEKHDYIRSVDGIFSKAKKTIGLIDRMREDYPNLGLGVATVFSSYNSKDIPEVLNFVNEFEVDSFDLNYMRGNVGIEACEDISLEMFEKAINYVNLNKRPSLRSSLPLSSFVWPVKSLVSKYLIGALRNRKMPISCSVAKKKMVVISEDGELRPCEILSQSYGNLRNVKYDIFKLINSSKAKEIQRQIAKGDCYCSWECAIVNSIVHNFSTYPSILKEWLAQRKTFINFVKEETKFK